MSLALLQGYSSAEEEEEGDDVVEGQFSSDEELNDAASKSTRSYKPLLDPNPPSSSFLPSAFDAFSEISGPPQFLNNSVQDDAPSKEDGRWRHDGRRNRKDKKDVRSGAVLEAKPQLVGIHERVRSDIESGGSQGQSAGPAATTQGGKRMATVGNPTAEDAAELLRMCVRCGIPKTYSHARGVVCPVCGDRPPEESEPVKKKGSTVKDKEKSKRMRGQSSHATWKSETEMQLRQQFD